MSIAIFVFVYHNVTSETIGQLIVFGIWVLGALLFNMSTYVMIYLFENIDRKNETIN